MLRMAQIAWNHGLGLLVIDEIFCEKQSTVHRLLFYGKGNFYDVYFK